MADSARTSWSSTGLIGTLRGAATDGAARYRALGSARETRRLLLAAAGSYAGDRLNTIALIALSFELGDSALGVGGMLALMAVPRLLIQAPAGALVDRFPGKRLLMLSQALMAVVAASFALLAVLPSLWLLYGLALAMAVVRTVDLPAFELRLMALTPPEQRGTANAVHMLAWTAGEIVGPILGALLLALAGATPLFILNGLTFLVVLRVIASLPERIAAAEEEPEEEHAATGSPAAVPGYRALLGRSDVMLYLVSTVAACVTILGTVPLFIVRAHDLGLGDGGVGVFYLTMGVGTLIGGLLAGAASYTTRRALAVAGLTGAGGALFVIVFGFAGSLLLALPALVFYALIGDVQELSGMTYFQHTLPERVYGRFVSLLLMATGLGGLIGALGGPALAELIGTGATLTVLAIPTLVTCGLLALREGGMRLALPPFLPALEPEVVGHGMFGVPSQSDLIADGVAGGRILIPRLSRLA